MPESTLGAAGVGVAMKIWVSAPSGKRPNETSGPLTVYAIALVAAAAPNVDKKVFALLLPWALMGLPKCFGALDCYEDCILFASGVYGLVELVRNWRPREAQAWEEPLVQQEATE